MTDDQMGNLDLELGAARLLSVAAAEARELAERVGCPLPQLAERMLAVVVPARGSTAVLERAALLAGQVSQAVQERMGLLRHRMQVRAVALYWGLDGTEPLSVDEVAVRVGGLTPELTRRILADCHERMFGVPDRALWRPEAPIEGRPVTEG
jgi:hypothetical protein